MINIAVIFGGKSVEHEVSIITAMQAIGKIEAMEGYKPIPIYITKNGDWVTCPEMTRIEPFKDLPSLLKIAIPVGLVRGEKPETAKLIGIDHRKNTYKGENIDIVFPIIHGTGGEDGTLQGLLEMMEIPYIGCSPLSAAISMDKIMTKFILDQAGISQAKYLWFYSEVAIYNTEEVADTIEQTLGYPIIIKPADVGSSVGIKAAYHREELIEAIQYAINFSTRVIAEKMFTNAYEVNISVLGDNSERKLSVCERPLKEHEFLTYEDKYMSQGASKGMLSTKREIPAHLDKELEDEIRKIADAAFLILDCSGVCRIDFFVDKDTNRPFLCELNTIPGSLSFYLWEATGLNFTKLIEELIKIAHRVRRRKKAILRSTDYNLLNQDNLLGVKK